MVNQLNKQATSGSPRSHIVILSSVFLLFPIGAIVVLLGEWPRFRWKLALLAGGGMAFCVQVLLVMLACGFSAGDAKASVRRGLVLWWRDTRVAIHRQSYRADPSLEGVLQQNDTASDWPGYRGANRDGIATVAAINLQWPESGPPVVWKQPIGGGQSSIAVQRGRVYTIEQRHQDEVVACYSLSTGHEFWTYRYKALFKETWGGRGPCATPTLNGKNVLALGATGVLNCLHAETGKRLWHRNILVDAKAENLKWGMAGSPLVHDGLVYVIPGGANASVCAYDLETGQPVWQAGDNPAGYASPFVAKLAGVPQLLAFDGVALTSYDPAKRKLLWSFDWKTDEGINAAQPIVVGQNRVFISAGKDQGCALVRVVLADGQLSTEQVWYNKNLKLRYSSAVLYQGNFYGPDNKILACLDVETGKRRWKGGRYGYCQPILVAGHLVIQCENGDVALVEATPDEHRELVRFKALQGKNVSPPVIAQGRLVVRSDREMVCFDLSN